VTPIRQCEVCGARRAIKGAPLLKLNEKRYCELHYPLIDKDGNLTEKAEWPAERHERVLHGFRESLRLSECSHVHLVGDIDVHSKAVGALTMSDSVIKGHVALHSCVLSDVRITRVRVLGGVRFERCKLNGTVVIEECTIAGQAMFVDCDFQQDVHFGGTTFDDLATFEASAFSRYASFRDCTFRGYSIFRCVKFYGYFTFKRVTLSRESQFLEARFSRVTAFDAATFNENASFSGAVFGRAPTFQDVKFRGSLFLDETVFEDTTSHEAYAAYRTLRVILGEKKARADEIRLFKLEQQALRRRERGSVSGVLSWAYEFTSNYGTSVEKSVRTLLLVNVACLAYYTYICSSAPHHGHAGRLALSHALAQLFAPFYVWRESGVPQWASHHTFAIQVVSSTQSSVSFILVAFMTFALHWRFKRD
jgi:uncharacterized protein YjbI with pentapeptide repeats